MNRQKDLEAGIMDGMLLVLLFSFMLAVAIAALSIKADADETKATQVPVKYKEAQDIMAKKNIDGKKKKKLTAEQMLAIQVHNAIVQAEKDDKEAARPSESADGPVVAVNDAGIPPAPPRGNEPGVDYATIQRLKAK